MNEMFFISDTHFGHANILNFTTYEGERLRHFDTVEEMDEHMVKQWNDTVGPNDTVYHLGDVTMNAKFLPIVGRLNGRKKLVRGNHDTAKLSKYSQFFVQIHGAKVFAMPRKYGGGFIATHIPIHEQSLARFKANVHGHLHANNVLMSKWYTKKDVIKVEDPRYINVSVEQINYTPIHFDAIVERIQEYAP